MSNTTNPFALLDVSSDSETEVVHNPTTTPVLPTTPVSPPFRVWKLNEQETNTRMKKGSPFQIKKKNQRVKYEEDHEGWISIRYNQPQFDLDNLSTDSEKEIKKEVLMEALSLEPVTPTENDLGCPSLLERGHSSEMTAMDWAERVRANLERAEQSRGNQTNSTDEFAAALGRLSFFRRPLTTTENQ